MKTIALLLLSLASMCVVTGCATPVTQSYSHRIPMTQEQALGVIQHYISTAPSYNWSYQGVTAVDAKGFTLTLTRYTPVDTFKGYSYTTTTYKVRTGKEARPFSMFDTIYPTFPG